MKEGVVILSHGSKKEDALKALNDLVEMLGGGPSIRIAHMQFASPTLQESVKDLVAQGYQRIIVMPLFLLAGEHVTADVPELVKETVQSYPHTEIRMAPHLGIDHRIAQSVLDRLAEARGPQEETGGDIETRSMAIIDALLPQYSGEAGYLVKRLVHSVGDVSAAALICFSGDALQRGLAALRSGCEIVTDVRMVEAGIDKKRTSALGCAIHCGLDSTNEESGDEQQLTRTAKGIRASLLASPRAVVVIGNAPTALEMVIEMAKKRQIDPALVIGIPVGFVGADESKERLIESGMPYVTVRGTRGGTPMAVSALNTLLRLATGHGLA